MIKEWNIMCPGKNEAFINVSLSRNTVADDVCELANTFQAQLMENEHCICP